MLTYPRFVSSYKPAGTRSFRAAASQLFSEYGGNAQNPGAELLESLGADSGKIVVQSDQAGAEALVVAYLAERGNYRKLFECGIKPHTFMAMHLFPDRWPFVKSKDYYLTCPVEELKHTPGWKDIDKAIKKSDSEPGRPYYIGKKTCHGKSYDMKWRTFQLSVLKDSGGALALTKDQSCFYLDMFDRLFPEIIELQKETILEARTYRVLANLFGYPRAFERIFTDSYNREILSFKPQSTVGCITHIACEKMQDYIEDNNKAWDLLSNKHDSLATQVPATKKDVLECSAKQEEFLAAKLIGRGGIEFIMKSETQIGRRWAKYDKFSIPDGMKEISEDTLKLHDIT